VSVNLSTKQFMDYELVEQVRLALQESGLAASYLELEITESVLAEDATTATTILAQLKNLGVYIAIDDFGTGYSSLSYLMNFPVDCLKIDRSFIKECTKNKSHAKLARAIIVMAKSLGLSTVAEGVEELTQLAFVDAEGCDEVQGYLYSKPVSSAEFLGQVNSINLEFEYQTVRSG